MLYKKRCPEDTPVIPVIYEFLEPVRIRIRKPDGSIVLMGYGIGERVQVLEPRIQFAVVCHERLIEIPLADGSFMIEFPDNMRTKMVYER